MKLKETADAVEYEAVNSAFTNFWWNGPAMIDDILFGYVNRWLGAPQAPASPLLRAGEHA